MHSSDENEQLRTRSWEWPMSTEESAPQDRSWATIYRSAVVVAAVTGERERLRAHQPAPGGTRCQACAGVAPCEEARTATTFLVERGIPLIRLDPAELSRLASRRGRRAAPRHRTRALLARCPVAHS
jgi:hypothetical protein